MGEKREKIDEVLLKVALGYQLAEVTEEYAEIDGTLKLTKRKKTKKDVPPDLKAVQMLLGGGEVGEYGEMTDEELEEEKQRLLGALKTSEGKKNVVKKKTAVKVDEGKKERPKPRKRVVRKKE